MRYAVLSLPCLLVLAACAGEPVDRTTSVALVAPDNCLDPERKLHRDWLQLCAELNED